MMINVVSLSTPRVSFDTFFQFSFQPSLSPEIMPQSITINFIPFLPLPSAFQSVYAWGKTQILNKSTLSHFQILNKSTLSHFQILFFSRSSWYPSQVTVFSAENFNLVFEASVGSQGSGDIAIDTMTYSPGPCPRKLAGFLYIFMNTSTGSNVLTNMKRKATIIKKNKTLLSEHFSSSSSD